MLGSKVFAMVSGYLVFIFPLWHVIRQSILKTKKMGRRGAIMKCEKTDIQIHNILESLRCYESEDLNYFLQPVRIVLKKHIL